MPWWTFLIAYWALLGIGGCIIWVVKFNLVTLPKHDTGIDRFDSFAALTVLLIVCMIGGGITMLTGCIAIIARANNENKEGVKL